MKTKDKEVETNLGEKKKKILASQELPGKLGAMFDPPRKPIPNPPGNGPPLLLVVIDTEEEFDWSRPHSRENTAVTTLAAQSLAQAIFDARGLVPTYLVDYPVATSGLARETLVPWATAGRCLIGAHLHPWVNPPF